MSDQHTRQGIIFFVVLAVLIGIVFLLPSTMRNQALDLQCKLRLKRLGDAVNYWVYDHNFIGFPQIENPKPQSDWDPRRLNSASNVLRQYLGGDIPRMRHDKESKSEYYQRLRDQELTVCPVTGYEYWYNSLALGQADARKMSQAPEFHSQQIPYFQCQHTSEDLPAHEVDDQLGAHAAYGVIVQRIVTKQDLNQLQRQLANTEQQQRKQGGKDDLGFLRRRVAHYSAALKKHPEGFPAITLDTDIRFIADQPSTTANEASE